MAYILGAPFAEEEALSPFSIWKGHTSKEKSLSAQMMSRISSFIRFGLVTKNIEL